MPPAASKNDPLRKRLGQAIKAVRTEKRIQQEKVGDSGNISRLEKGLQWISEERLVEIAAALDVPVWLLFARAERAMEGRLWELLEVYNSSTQEGQELIDQNVKVAKKHYKKREAVHTQLKVVRRNNGR